MKIMMIMKWDGVTPDQYEQVRKIVNWDNNVPKGGIIHVASFGDNALHVTDIWESAEEFQDFGEKRLMPGVVKAGIHSQPESHVYPVHNVFLPDAQILSEYANEKAALFEA